MKSVMLYMSAWDICRSSRVNWNWYRAGLSENVWATLCGRAGIAKKESLTWRETYLMCIPKWREYQILCMQRFVEQLSMPVDVIARWPMYCFAGVNNEMARLQTSLNLMNAIHNTGERLAMELSVMVWKPEDDAEFLDDFRSPLAVDPSCYAFAQKLTLIQDVLVTGAKAEAHHIVFTLSHDAGPFKFHYHSRRGGQWFPPSVLFVEDHPLLARVARRPRSHVSSIVSWAGSYLPQNIEHPICLLSNEFDRPVVVEKDVVATLCQILFGGKVKDLHFLVMCQQVGTRTDSNGLYDVYDENDNDD